MSKNKPNKSSVNNSIKSPIGSVTLLLVWTLLFSPLAVRQDVYGQTPGQRERRAAPTVTPSPATPIASPTPLAAPVMVQPGAMRSLDQLRIQLATLTRQAQFAPAQVAVKVVSLETNKVMFEENAGKLLAPASNMKLYTVAAALDQLTPGFTFKTSVYAAARPDANGAVRGDLVIYGRGDPSFAARFQSGDYFRAIDEFAAQIVAAGVRRVEGNLVADESYFTGAPLAAGWEWDDLQWYYGAEVSALSVNDNAIDLMVKPGASVGAPCDVTTGPAVPFIKVVNANLPNVFDLTTGANAATPNTQGTTLTTSGASSGATTENSTALFTVLNYAKTAPRGTTRSLRIHRAPGANVIEVSGSAPVGDSQFSSSVAVPRPALLFALMLRRALETRGVTIVGRTVRRADEHNRGTVSLPSVEIAARQSPPLSVIAAQCLKPSQNLYAELLLRAVGASLSIISTPNRQTTAESGASVVKSLLRKAGAANVDSLSIADGSGLSRLDLVTADATTRLLAYMARHPNPATAAAFREALPVAGVDGTLRNRMRQTLAASNVRAKTGTLTGVTSLSGYVTSAAGERLAFSIILNNFPADADARKLTDQIAVALAAFAGHS